MRDPLTGQSPAAGGAGLPPAAPAESPALSQERGGPHGPGPPAPVGVDSEAPGPSSGLHIPTHASARTPRGPPAWPAPPSPPPLPAACSFAAGPRRDPWRGRGKGRTQPAAGSYRRPRGRGRTGRRSHPSAGRQPQLPPARAAPLLPGSCSPPPPAAPLTLGGPRGHLDYNSQHAPRQRALKARPPASCAGRCPTSLLSEGAPGGR